MIVKPLDLAMIQQMNEVSNIKQQQDSRPAVEQQNMFTHIEKKADEKSEQVNKKEDVDNQQKKYDAKDKSSNEYARERNKSKTKSVKEDGKVSIKINNKDTDFDIRI